MSKGITEPDILQSLGAAIVEARQKADAMERAVAEQASKRADESLEALKAAKQRELELLAVIERKGQQVDKFVNLCEELIGSKDYVGTGSLKSAKAEEREDREKLKQIVSISETESSQALREYEANVLEELLDTFAFFQTEEGLWLANAIRRMAEERRKK